MVKGIETKQKLIGDILKEHIKETTTTGSDTNLRFKSHEEEGIKYLTNLKRALATYRIPYKEYELEVKRFREDRNYIGRYTKEDYKVISKKYKDKVILIRGRDSYNKVKLGYKLLIYLTYDIYNEYDVYFNYELRDKENKVIASSVHECLLTMMNMEGMTEEDFPYYYVDSIKYVLL